MRNYEYGRKWEILLTPEIVGYLTMIHEFRGEQRLIADKYADVLVDLVEIAKIQSTESSNRIEGIHTSDEQLRKLVLDKTMPKQDETVRFYFRLRPLPLSHYLHSYKSHP